MTAQQSHVPKLRFPEFSEPWEKALLGDIATFSKGKGISKSDVDTEGKTYCVRYGELYTTYDTIIDEPVSKTSIEPESLVLSKGGEVIVPASGETAEDIATAAVVLRDGIALGGDLNIIKSPLNGGFLAPYLSGKKRMILASMAQGISVVHLYPAQLAAVHIGVPSREEQDKIALLLGDVDERIFLLSEKLKTYEDYQKTCLKNVFSQTIRFKKNRNIPFPDWEKKAIGDVLTIGSGRDYKSLGEGDIPVYGTGGYMLSVDNYLYDGESVCIGRKGTIDKPVLLTGKFWTVDTLFYTHSFRSVLPRFVYAVFKLINWQKYNEASGVPSLSKTTIESIKIAIPCLLEQQKIVEFLTQIDSKVALVAEELELTRSFKKGLLQQMFV